MQVIPPALAAFRHFVLHDADKRPLSPHTGRVADPHDPTQWVDGPTVLQAMARHAAAGIGFVFTVDCGLFFLDIDHALQPDGQWSALAVDLCQRFAGCYVEVSRSGTGLHIIGSTGPIVHPCRNQAAGLELYTSGRYCALTGLHAQGDPLRPAPEALAYVLSLPGWSSGTAVAPAEWTSRACTEYTGPADDADLITRMLASRSTTGAFSGKASVADLWNRNETVLAAVFPPQTDANPFDHSSADAALCAHLAFWTGRDCERMDRLFRQSGLYREKWERTGYMQSTVLGAVARCQAVYSHQRELPTVDRAEIPEPVAGNLRDSYQYLSVPTQVEYFKGCIYIRDLHRVFTPDGALLKQEQFRSSWGGHTFHLDTIGDKTTRNAWEALTENQGYKFPQAHDACFRPELPSGVLLEEEGRTVVNTYVPIVTPCKPGDPAPFLGHVSRMLPLAADRDILLAYMAALVQLPGKKFQWWPLVQGTEGNGKSLLIRVLSYCVGARYSHTPNAKDIDNKFNAWLRNKLFIGVEEIYTADRQDKIDALKPLITNDRIEIQGKGQDQLTGDNRANGLLNSNHKDAIRKTTGDRRYCVFYTAQQEAADLAHYGMCGDYFPDLYDWLRADGYAIVNHYLRSYAIPDALNPATHCHRAPVTSSTAEAITASLGGIEQRVMEAVEEGIPGFAGGWISSTAFDALVERGPGRVIPPGRRRDVLRGLGYEWHIALPDGRVNNPIVEDGKPRRPRLYVRKGSPAEQIRGAAEVVKAYQAAQSGQTVAGAAFGG